MTTTLGAALLLTAAATLYKAVKGKNPPRHLEAADLAKATRPRHWSHPVLFGAAIGALVSLTSVGAGAIGVTVLMLVSRAAAAPHHRRRHRLRRSADAGGRAGPRLHRFGRLDAAGHPAGRFAARYLAGFRLVRHAPDRLIRSLLSLLLAYAGARLITL